MQRRNYQISDFIFPACLSSTSTTASLKKLDAWRIVRVHHAFVILLPFREFFRQNIEEAVLLDSLFYLCLVVQEDVRENGPRESFCFIRYF